MEFVFAGRRWQPTRLERVIRTLQTSTRALHVATDAGPAILKYMGNPAHSTALICELVGSELACAIGLSTPDFAIADVPQIELPDPLLTLEPGPGFFSRWEEAVPLSPGSDLLSRLRHPEQISRLVVFDTWVRNGDRFASVDPLGNPNQNFDNVLLKEDKRKVQLLAIDCTHAFVETTLEDELGADWIDEEVVYGLFEDFRPLLSRSHVEAALAAVHEVDEASILRICSSVPREWDMTGRLADRMSECILARASKLKDWLPEALFEQREMDV